MRGEIADHVTPVFDMWTNSVWSSASPGSARESFSGLYHQSCAGDLADLFSISVKQGCF